jgi:hypothetical protein
MIQTRASIDEKLDVLMARTAQARDEAMWRAAVGAVAAAVAITVMWLWRHRSSRTRLRPS